MTAEPLRPAPAHPSRHPDGYLEARPDGTFTEVAEGVARPFEVPRSQAPELRELLSLRDTAVRLLEAEAAVLDDTRQTQRLRGELGHRYDGYVRRYGPLNRFSLRRTGRTDPATGEPVMSRVAPGQGGFRGDPFAPLVYALEEFEPTGQRRLRSSPTGWSLRASPAWARTQQPTRWRSASTLTVRPG